MNLQRIKEILSSETERNKFINEEYDATLTYYSHPIVEAFKNAEIDENFSQEEFVVELIIKHFGHVITPADLKYLRDLFPGLGERLLKAYLCNIPLDFAETILAFLKLYENGEDKNLLIAHIIENIISGEIDKNNFELKQLLFKKEFSLASHDRRMTLLNNVLDNPSLSGALFTREPGVIYITNPIVEFFKRCEKANPYTRRVLAKRIVIKYGNSLFTDDFEYLCEQYRSEETNLLLNFCHRFSNSFLELSLKRVLTSMISPEDEVYIEAVLSKISLAVKPEMKVPTLLSVCLISRDYIKSVSLQLLFDQYLRPVCLGDKNVALARLDLCEIEKYLKIVVKFLPLKDFLNLIDSCTANTLLGSPKALPRLFLEYSEQVTKELMLEIFDTIDATYSKLLASTRTPLPLLWWPQTAVVFYQAELKKFFFEYYGKDIEVYRTNKTNLKLIRRESIFAEPGLPEIGFFQKNKTEAFPEHYHSIVLTSKP